MTRMLVIVPTYNEAENIERLADEVLAQDACIELLVVDDNSPDGTGDIADGLAAEGGGQPHENRPPVLGVHYIIALLGIFPARD